MEMVFAGSTRQCGTHQYGQHDEGADATHCAKYEDNLFHGSLERKFHA
jgi:hypothetical protein